MGHRFFILPLLLLLLLTVAQPLTAGEVEDFRYSVVRDGWTLVHGYWQANSLNGQTSSPAVQKERELLAERLQRAEQRLVEKLTDAGTQQDNETLQAFERFLLARPQAEREALAGVLEQVREAASAQLHDRPTVYLPDGLYIPGYGMPDPDYIYARTDTVETKVVGHYWQERYQHLVVNELWQGTVAVAIIPKLQEKVHDFQEIGPVMTVTYTDKEMKVRIVSFRMNSYWRFRVLRRFGITRTDFELWKAEKDAWYLHWERCGTCYELSEVVEDPRVITDIQ